MGSDIGTILLLSTNDPLAILAALSCTGLDDKPPIASHLGRAGEPALIFPPCHLDTQLEDIRL
jgi:hypothetical protein